MSPEVSVSVARSAAAPIQVVTSSASHWSCATSLSEQAIIVWAGSEVQTRESSVSSCGANVVLQPR